MELEKTYDTFSGSNHKLKTGSTQQQEVNIDKKELTSINGNKYLVNNDACFKEINIHPNPFCYNDTPRPRKKYLNRTVFTFVRPSPCHKRAAHSSTSISRTRQLASLAKSLQHSLSDRSFSPPARTGRIFDGARLLFCQTRWKRTAVDSFLVPQESLCDQDDGLAPTRLVSEQLNRVNHGKLKNPDMTASTKPLASKFLERQRAFEDEDDDIPDLTLSQKISLDSQLHQENDIVDETMLGENGLVGFHDQYSTNDCQNTDGSNLLIDQESRCPPEYKTDFIKTCDQTIATTENYSANNKTEEDLDQEINYFLSSEVKRQSYSELTVTNKQDNESLPTSLPENTANEVTDVAQYSTKKVSRVKLALTTSHAGIFVTGDSQDDDVETCPSWVGNHDVDSSYLTPHYQPSISSNEDKVENIVILQTRRRHSISLNSTRQISNSSEKDSYPSSSPRSKTSGYSVQDSGFEASGRQTNVLLSPSFRKLTIPISRSGEGYSSDEYHAYPHEERPSQRDKNRKRSISDVTVSRSAENNKHARPHSCRYSNSSEGDSGLDPDTFSPRAQRLSVHSSRHTDKSSRFSIQSKLSSKSVSIKSDNQSSKGSFLSFLSPKSILSRSGGGSETGKSSYTSSKSSRKRLSDFPDDEKLLILNVSGRKFKLHEYFTSVYPETLLGNSRRNKFYDAKTEEFFFDRDPDIFRHIWNFYYTGKLHFPKDECVNLFVDEMSFFGVSEDYFCTCCWEDEYEPAVEKLNKLTARIKKTEQELQAKARRIPEDASLKEKIWLTTKYPVISLQARVFYLFSIVTIIISTIANITETIPCSNYINICKANNQEIYFYIDVACVSFFTAEYLARLITAPKCLAFIRQFMNIIDLLAIVPFYCDLLLQLVFGTSAGSAISFLEILRILRIVRIFKLLKNSRRLQALVHTFSSSTTELGLIVVIYMVLVTVFSSMIYYAEMQDNPKYSSIPESMWYAVITTTTTGYGDIVPETILGKLVGSACCLLGVLIVALPIPILQIRD